MLADRKYPLSLAAFFGLYVVAGKLGLSLAFVHASASPVWLRPASRSRRS